MRLFLGVDGYAPVAGLKGDIGDISLSVNRCIYMVRFWNSLLNIGNTRITKRVFVWDYRLNKNNWSSHMESLLAREHNINSPAIFNLQIEYDVENVRVALKMCLLRNGMNTIYFGFSLSHKKK